MPYNYRLNVCGTPSVVAYVTYCLFVWQIQKIAHGRNKMINYSLSKNGNVELNKSVKIIPTFTAG